MSVLQIKVASDSAYIVYLDQPLGIDSANVLKQLKQHLLQQQQGEIVDVISSYLSLLVQYDPFVIDHFAVRQRIKSAYETVLADQEQTVQTGKIIELPVYYDTSVGPDLARIADDNDLSIEQVIECHSGTLYTIYAIGFAPGFAYLGEVDPIIATPRLATPRAKVAKGSVAIADQQTAIYPAQSPGGWNIIGRCPIELFDVNKSPSLCFETGDQIKFCRISEAEFLALGGDLS